MVKNARNLKKFEDKLKSKEQLTYKKALLIYEGLWREAVALGVFPPKDPMEGIEVDIRVAKILNSCSKSS